MHGRTGCMLGVLTYYTSSHLFQLTFVLILFVFLLHKRQDVTCYISYVVMPQPGCWLVDISIWIIFNSYKSSDTLFHANVLVRLFMYRMELSVCHFLTAWPVFNKTSKQKWIIWLVHAYPYYGGYFYLIILKNYNPC